MDGTVLQQGSFVQPTGVAGVGVTNQIIQIPANADFMWVKNYTQAQASGSTAPAIGYDFYWQRGMAAGTGFVAYKTNALLTRNDDTLSAGGFTLYDASGQSVGALPIFGPGVVFTAITNVTRPVITTASTASLIDSVSIFRLYLASGDTALASDMLGIDFTVSVINGTTFRPLAFLANAPGLTTGTGHWKLVNYDPLFYPRRRIVVNVSQAVNAQVTTAVAHQYVPGQAVRFNIPQISAMVQLNSNQQNNFAYATVVSVVDQVNFTIDIDTTAFTAFHWPTVAEVNLGTQYPEVTPIGENSANALLNVNAQTPLIYSSTGPQINATQTGFLSDATVNTGFLGMLLGGSEGHTPAAGSNITVTGPSGYAAGDVIYWVAGKSAFGGL